VCLWPAAMLRLFLFDQALWLILATLSAISLRRADILFNLPSFIVIRAINCLVLVRTFWLEIIRNKRRTQWFSVTRYQDVRPNSQTVGGLNA
jgi:hypothetical protein